MITSVFPVICTDDVAETSRYYVDLFDLAVVFESGWYVQLQAETDERIQLGIVERGHASVPAMYRTMPAGVIVSIEVDDVDRLYARARAAQLGLVVELRDEAWGQRHFMVTDPSGTLVDVIEPIEPTGEYAVISDG